MFVGRDGRKKKMTNREREINFVIRVITALLNDFQMRITTDDGSRIKVIDCDLKQEFYLMEK